jgi:hypothetical protein
MMLLPKYLPHGWKGDFVLLVMVCLLSSFLDNVAIECFRQWKFKPGTCAQKVRMPLTFTTHGLPRT